MSKRQREAETVLLPRLWRNPLFEPEVGCGAAAAIEPLEELPVEVRGALLRQALELLFGGDAADAQAQQLFRRAQHLSVPERLELGVERGIEPDLFEPGGDFAGRRRRPFRRRRRDLDDEQMGRL